MCDTLVPLADSRPASSLRFGVLLVFHVYAVGIQILDIPLRVPMIVVLDHGARCQCWLELGYEDHNTDLQVLRARSLLRKSADAPTQTWSGRGRLMIVRDY